MKEYRIQGQVEIFPQKGGWIYVRVPKRTEIGEQVIEREKGLILTIEPKVGLWHRRFRGGRDRRFSTDQGTARSFF